MSNILNSISRQAIKVIGGKQKEGIWPPECSYIFFQPDRAKMIRETEAMSEKKEK